MTQKRLPADFKPEMERFRELGRSAFVLGYTGLAGKALVEELNKAKIFQRVVLVGRREIPLDVGPEFEQKVVDFGKINEHKDIFQGLDTGFCCLGVSSKGISEADYIRITRDYCASAAQVAKEQGCKHFTMLTGHGTKKDSWYLFGRIKAELEEKLGEMNFDRLSIFRPAMILGDSEGMKTSEKLARLCFKPITYLNPTRLAISANLLARGMIVNAVKSPDPSIREVFENKDIHDLASTWKD